jgi:hypothetical protein
VFELAWTLLSQRRYRESADAFIKMTTINSWSVLVGPGASGAALTRRVCRSQATYYFIAAGP